MLYQESEVIPPSAFDELEAELEASVEESPATGAELVSISLSSLEVDPAEDEGELAASVDPAPAIDPFAPLEAQPATGLNAEPKPVPRQGLNKALIAALESEPDEDNTL